MVHICHRCYEAECKRLGVPELEVYTARLASLFKCDYCPNVAYYSLPGTRDQYAPPQIENC